MTLDLLLPRPSLFTFHTTKQTQFTKHPYLMKITKGSIGRRAEGLGRKSVIQLLGGLLIFLVVWNIYIDSSESSSSSFADSHPLLGISELKAQIKEDGGVDITEKQHRMIFHHYYKGKSGAVIEDMMFAHAYAYSINATYGGSCGEPHKLQSLHHSLLTSIGLQKILRFACPRDFRDQKGVRKSVVPAATFHEQDTKIWTPEYVKYLKSHVQYPTKQPDKHTVAVHVRRATDISPCLTQHKGYDRYLPNLHYQMLIDKYAKPESRVVIFSQSKSYEPLDSFKEKGYEVFIDDDITDVWKHIVTADVVILSRSDFSLIPAVVAKGEVVYTPFWHQPLQGWTIVDDNTMNATNAELERLLQGCPKHNRFGGLLRVNKHAKKLKNRRGGRQY